MAKKNKGGGKKKKANAELSTGELAAGLTQSARTLRMHLTRNLTEQGLYAGQDSVIVVLARSEGLSPGAIAEALGVRAPTITKTINRLAAQGFVEKRGSGGDGRKAEIYLSDKGRRAVAAIEKAIGRTEDAMLAGFTGKESRTLAKLLARLGDNLKRETATETARADMPVSDL